MLNRSDGLTPVAPGPWRRWQAWAAGGRRSVMRLGSSLLLALLLLMHAPATSAAENASKSTAFPPVTADALDKQKVILPAQLEGQANLLLLSFAPEQRNQIETWTAVAQALQHTSFSFHAYRLPVQERANWLFRWWANASLRSDETDPELWHWVVPIYVDKAALRGQLGIADEKSVVALLVDKTGRILWRATGNSTAASRASLASAVAEVLTATGSH